MTLWSLSAEIPGGVVAPSIVLGALLGRIYAQLLPDWWPGLGLVGEGTENPPDCR